MTTKKAVVYLLIVCVGVLPILHEAEGRLKQSTFTYQPPRLRLEDYMKIKNHVYQKPGDKKKRLRTELIAAGNKVVVQVPNPPIVFDHVFEYWPYHRVYATSFLGIVNYIHKISRLAYKVVWIFIDMALLLVKILFQLTEIGKLRHSYDELSKPHPFSYHDDDDDKKSFHL